MKITRIEYEGKFALDNYEFELIRLAAQVEIDDVNECAGEVNQIIDKLRSLAITSAQPNAKKLRLERQILEDYIDVLEKQAEETRKKWDSISQFLKAQGIKSDVPDFPELEKFLPIPQPPEIHEDF